MLKSLSTLAMVLLLLASCSRDESGGVPKTTKQTDPLTPAQINAYIEEAIKKTGSFEWKTTTDHFVWSAVSHGNNIVSIGFGKTAGDFDRSKSSGNAVMQRDLLQLIADYEGRAVNKILLAGDPFLNNVDVYVTKVSTIEALRRAKNIRYVEPGDYRYFALTNGTEKADATSSSSSSSGSGCGFESLALNSGDFTTITPDAKAPWTFYQHNIPNAWAVSTGAGVTIGIVDTGTSPNQTLLGANFNDGLSSGRTIQKYGAYVDSTWPWSTGTDGPNDQCGHGTSMAGTAAAPRNDNGLPLGVAYNANLVTYRAASNVVLDGYHEQNGVKNALTALGNNNNVKIISMSMGHIYSVGKISDGIKYAFNKGKLIFCAAGTSTDFTTFVGVIFPASMAETVAVTGVKDTASYQACADCHTGNKVDFTIVMERASTGKHSPVVSYYDNQTDYIGGSSVATATTAGIAALVWSKYPTWTRTQILTRMKQSATFYPTKNSQFGHGNINAALAVQ